MTGPRPHSHTPTLPHPSRRRWVHFTLVLVCLALGTALRLYRLGELPPGLYQDEAYNGLDALDVIAGARPLYFPANNGREPLFIYLVAASVAAFGRTAFAVRLPAAMLGVLALPATYALGRALFGRGAGLLAMAVAAVTFWPLALSRIGFRAGGLPVVAALALAAAAVGVRRWLRQPSAPGQAPGSRVSLRPGRRGRLGLGWIALGGALYGLTFYTYLAARFTPLALGAFLIFWYIAERRTFPTLRQLSAFALPAALVALPLGLAALRQPEILLGRAGQVSILNPAISHGDVWGTLFDNLIAALGMFVWRGDDIARHNLPGRPVFDLLLGLAFVAGVVLAGRVALRRGPRRLAAALALVWTAVMLLPTVLAEDTPHFLRAVGVLPVIFLFPALALEALWHTGRIAGLAPSVSRWLARVLALAVLALGALLTVRDYFGRYASAADTAYLFQSAAAELARAGNAYLRPAGPSRGGNRRLYLDRRYWDQFASVRFLLPEQAGLRLYAEGQALPTDPGPQMRLIAWPYRALEPALQVLPAGSAITPVLGPLHRDDLQPEPYALYASYTAEPACAAVDCSAAPVAEFGGVLALRAWQAQAEPGGMALTLAWVAPQALGRDYQVFAQAYAGGDLVAQADGPLGTWLYPSHLWPAGATVLDQRHFVWPAGTDATGVEVLAGVYDLHSGARLPRSDASGDSVTLAP